MPRKKGVPVCRQLSANAADSADAVVLSRSALANHTRPPPSAHKEHEFHDDNAPSLDEYTLLAYWELPSWLQHNPHIKTGYRAKFTLRLTLLSLFRLHNETVNVWTHLIGFLLMLGITIHTTVEFWDSHWLDKAMFYVSWFSALLCLAASTLYHLMHCYSARACYNFALIDYTSIAVLVVGSFYPTVYYGFAHGRTWQILYLSAITLLGLVGMIGPFFPRFHEPEFRVIRTLLFVGTAGFGLIPTTHARYVIAEPEIHMRIYQMFASYGVGTLIYGLRIPERWWPGKFDLLLSSHQIWHVFVLLGIWFHHNLCRMLYERWMQIGYCEAHDLLTLA